jgi:hypothetical protein
MSFDRDKPFSKNNKLPTGTQMSLNSRMKKSMTVSSHNANMIPKNEFSFTPKYG